LEKKNQSSPDAALKYNQANKQARIASKNARQNYLWNLGRGPKGQQNLWKYIHRQSGHRNLLDVFNNCNTLDNPNVRLAKAFAENFSSNFNNNIVHSEFLPSSTI
jgi:hypothetical protein